MKNIINLFLLTLFIPIYSFSALEGECKFDCSDCKNYEARNIKFKEIKNTLKTNIENHISKPSGNKMKELYELDKGGKDLELRKINLRKAMSDPEYIEYKVYSKLESVNSFQMSPFRDGEINDYIRLNSRISRLTDVLEDHYDNKLQDDQFFLPMVSMMSEDLVDGLITCTLEDKQFLNLRLDRIKNKQ